MAITEKGLTRRDMLVIGVACSIALFPFSGSAQQPTTVANLLDRGGKRLTRDEVAALLSGATVSGTQIGRPTTTFEMLYKADGTASGTAFNRAGSRGDFRGGVLTVTGTWTIDADGRLCVDLRNNYGDPIQGCTVYFLLEGSYYSASGEGTGAELYRRDIKR